MSDWFSRKVARLTITAYLDEVEREAPVSDPASAGWRLVPVEPDEMQIVQMRDAFKATRASGIGGQTIEATFAADYAREIAAYRAAIASAPEPPVSDVRLDRTYAWSEAAAFRAGRIKQAEEDAKILREQLADAKRPGEAQVERDTYRDERDAALAKVERLTEMLRLVEIKQPDGEGHVWASFTTPHRQSGAFNLGSADKFATKVALEFERLRCAALTSKE